MNTFEVREIDTAQIDAHPWNRKELDRSKLDLLKEDIAANGVETPLCLRQKLDGRYEIIKGERRWTVAKELELGQVPAFIAEKDDLAAYLTLLRDNLQREQLSPLQEAASYHRLLEMSDDKGEPFTPEKIHQLLKVDMDTVYRRLKLVNLPVNVREALSSGAIGEEHAYQIGRLPTPKMRDEAAELVLTPREWNGQVHPPLSRADTRSLIREKFMVSVKGVEWKRDDPTLVPVELEKKSGLRLRGGACTDCPHLAQNNPAFRSDLGGAVPGQKGKGTKAGIDPLTCLNPECFRMKQDAHGKRLIDDARKEGTEVMSAKDAKEEFGSHSELRYGSKFEKLEDRPGYEELGHYDSNKVPTWKALKDEAEKQGYEVPVVMALNPNTREVVKLVKRDAMVEVARKVRPDLFKKSGAKGKVSDAEAKARKAENDQQKLKGAMAHEGLTALRDAICSKGMTTDQRMLRFEIVLDAAGSDGAFLLGKWLDIKIDKKVSGRDYKPGILAYVKAHAKKEDEIEAYTTLAILSRFMKWNGTEVEDFRDLAATYKIEMKDLQARAKATLANGRKKPAEPEAKKPEMKTRSEAVQRNQESVAAGEKAKFAAKKKPSKSERLKAALKTPGTTAKVVKKAKKKK